MTHEVQWLIYGHFFPPCFYRQCLFYMVIRMVFLLKPIGSLSHHTLTNCGPCYQTCAPIPKSRERKKIHFLFDVITCESLYGYWPLVVIVISISIECACLIYMKKERRDGKFFLSPQEIINSFRLFYHLSMNNLEILNKQFGNVIFSFTMKDKIS